MEILTAGVLSAVIALFGKRVLDVPGEVRQHDARIRNRDEDLATWIADDDQTVSRRHAELKQSAFVQSGIHAHLARSEMRRLHGKVQHRYRDQLREAARLVREIEVSERLSHRLYRFATRQPLPRLQAPDNQRERLERWNDESFWETLASRDAA